MKPSTVSELKKELKHSSKEDLIEYVLRLSKFKKENKELLSYLLFDAINEEQYIEKVKEEIHTQFLEINTGSYYFINKSVRKILRNTKKHIRYTQNKETEVRLMIYFCTELRKIRPSITAHLSLNNLYLRIITSTTKTISQLHEDLQFDFSEEIKSIS